MRVVIIGGSFGGMTTAYQLRRRLAPGKCEIRLISRERRFVFVPSLPWVVMGSKTLDQISFDLERPLASKKIDFTHATVLRVDPQAQKVVTEGEEYPYDYLVIATGHRSANEAVPGLGPFDGSAHSPMSPPEAEEAREAVKRLLEDPGPMVVGCAPGASCLGPAYEFAFQIDHLMRKRKIRHLAPMTFLTPEPFLGHMGAGGMGRARQFIEAEFEERSIRYHTSAAISKITDSSVELADGQVFESRFSLIIPPLSGVDAMIASPDLGNLKGFVPVDQHYRHQEFPSIYAAGVAVAFSPVDETPVPVNFLKTAHMTEQMAEAVAHNIAADVEGGEKKSRPLYAECILDMGDGAVRLKVNPVRPPRNVADISEGKRWLWAKRFFERYYLWKAKRGKTVSSGLGW